MPPPNLLAASAQILGQPHQATAPTGSERRGVHIVLDLLHALREMLRGFVELAVRKLSVSEPSNVGDHGSIKTFLFIFGRAGYVRIDVLHDLKPADH